MAALFSALKRHCQRTPTCWALGLLYRSESLMAAPCSTLCSITNVAWAVQPKNCHARPAGGRVVECQ